MCSMKLCRAPVAIDHHHFRLHSVLIGKLVILIFRPHFRFESVILWISVLLRSRVRHVFSETGKLRDRFRQTVREAIARRFLKDERRRGRVVLRFGRRGQRILSIVLMKVRLGGGSVSSVISNDEIESGFRWSVVRILTSGCTVTVHRSENNIVKNPLNVQINKFTVYKLQIGKFKNTLNNEWQDLL